jgi:hypothetical protein
MQWTTIAILSVLLSLTACGDDGRSPGDSGTGGDTSIVSDTSTASDTMPGADAGDICESGCVLSIAAACDNGPTGQGECVTDCNGLRAGPCGTEFNAYIACGEGEDVTCDADGQVIIEACATERAAFLSCLAG